MLQALQKSHIVPMKVLAKMYKDECVCERDCNSLSDDNLDSWKDDDGAEGLGCQSKGTRSLKPWCSRRSRAQVPAASHKAFFF